MLAAAGYPASYDKGMPISGCGDAGALDGVTVFHAGRVLVSPVAPPIHTHTHSTYTQHIHTHTQHIHTACTAHTHACTRALHAQHTHNARTHTRPITRARTHRSSPRRSAFAPPRLWRRVYEPGNVPNKCLLRWQRHCAEGRRARDLWRPRAGARPLTHKTNIETHIVQICKTRHSNSEITWCNTCSLHAVLPLTSEGGCVGRL